MSKEQSDAMERLKQALLEDDAEQVQSLLLQHPQLKTRMDEPVGAFDGRIINQVRSRRMFDVVLAAGADINAKSGWWAGGFGLLDNAAPELARYAIERGAIVDVHAAARLGLSQKLQELISEDPKRVHARGGDGQTPLHFASSVEIAKYLLSQGADFNARDIDHESTPAQYMIRDRQEVARFLVQQGCMTDLLMGAALGEVAIVQKHLDQNPASIQMRVTNQYFPKQNPRSGGTIYIWTLGQNKTAHVIAHEFGHKDVFNLLMRRSPETLQLVVAGEIGDESVFHKLLTNNPNLLRSLSSEELKSLPNAAQNDNIPAVKLMLSANWPVDARGQHGATALHWAAYQGNAEMAELLLDFHPNLNCTDTDFHATALGWAIHNSVQGENARNPKVAANYARIVEMLLKAGMQPLEQIAGSDAVKEVLRKYGASQQ